MAKLVDSLEGLFLAPEMLCVTYLTPQIAIRACETAAEHRQLIVRIEGGIWREPQSFEARLDCIWDGSDPPVEAAQAIANNLQAAEFVRSETPVHTAFVLTSTPTTHWRHKKRTTGAP
jgi:hypothetical protein